MTSKTKIRIRTFVLGANHGQLLQALGMKQVLSELAPDADVRLDLYHNHVAKEIYSQVRHFTPIKFLTLLANWLKWIPFGRSRSTRNLTVFGADTIWMYNHPVAPNDLFYFGQDITDGQKLAISPSNAGSPYPIENPQLALVEEFDFVGVRDNATQGFVGRAVGKSVPVVCDPAFYLSSDIYSSPELADRQNAVSIYANSCKSIKPIIDSFVAERSHQGSSWRYDYVGYFPKFYSSFRNQSLGISGVMHKIASSKLLVTDTFHGVIMALMTQTPFILVGSHIVLSRLDGPLMNAFSDARICKLTDLADKMNDDAMFQRTDIDSKQIDEFVGGSKSKIKAKLDTRKNLALFDGL